MRVPNTHNQSDVPGILRLSRDQLMLLAASRISKSSSSSSISACIRQHQLQKLLGLAVTKADVRLLLRAEHKTMWKIGAQDHSPLEQCYQYEKKMEHLVDAYKRGDDHAHSMRADESSTQQLRRLRSTYGPLVAEKRKSVATSSRLRRLLSRLWQLLFDGTKTPPKIDSRCALDRLERWLVAFRRREHAAAGLTHRRAAAAGLTHCRAAA